MTKDPINVWSYLEQYSEEEDEIIQIVKDVFRSGKLILGENVSNSFIFRGKNDVICQNFGKIVKKFLHSKNWKIIPGESISMNLTKKVIQCV